MRRFHGVFWMAVLAGWCGAGAFAAERPGAEAGDAIQPGTWVATDALRRHLPTAEEVGAPRAGRTVGMFYFLTHRPGGDKLPNNVADILAQDPDVLTKPLSPLWGTGGAYYWSQPLYGYYDSRDPWVLRRHANLLADAGVDTIIFDTTNRATYRDVYMKLCEVWTKVREEGGRTPQICFMVNTRAGESAQEIYNDLYKPSLYKDLWFQWQGKPLLICDPAEAIPELKEFFTLRKAHWPFTLVNTHNEWHWESTYPQVYSYDADAAQPEEVNVAVAQNLRASDGKVTNMSEGNARGRSFHDGKKDVSPGAVNQGYNFQEQWKRAQELAPPFVMVTGWNEWTAGKYSRPGIPILFVDQFDEEYSRDIEPVSGLHTDNYYYQLVANVRRYKGVNATPSASPAKAIDINGAFDQWQDVGPAFTDHAFDNDHRDFGAGVVHYENKSGRNDLITMKVARDEQNVYFYARTREALTPDTDANWMMLLIDSDSNGATGWEGYDFIVNRSREGGESWLEQNSGGWNWKRVAKVQCRVQGAELMLAVPRAALSLPEKDPLQLDFKWWDHAQNPGDIMDTYLVEIRRRKGASTIDISPERRRRSQTPIRATGFCGDIRRTTCHTSNFHDAPLPSKNRSLGAAGDDRWAAKQRGGGGASYSGSGAPRCAATFRRSA